MLQILCLVYVGMEKGVGSGQRTGSLAEILEIQRY